MNPYDSPAPIEEIIPSHWHRTSPKGHFVCIGLFVVMTLAGFLSVLVPAVARFTMPRFGWIGLILCMNPLIFLAMCVKSPTSRNFLLSAYMVFSVGVINAVSLLFTGTVSEVENRFTDRLHSSWYWSVLPFALTGIWLLLIARSLKKQENRDLFAANS